MTGADLRDWLGTEQYATMPQVPISIHRALSQIANPRRHTEDVLLLVAYDAKEMIGYLGVVPDTMYIDDQDVEHVGWLSCIWVSPMARGRGVSLKMVRQAARDWDGRLLLTEYVPSIKVLYDRSGVFDSTARQTVGLRIFYRWELATILPTKRPYFASYPRLLRLVDRLLNRVTDLRYLLARPPQTALAISHSPYLPSDAAAFVDQHCAEGLFRRESQWLQWALGHPWVLAGSPTLDDDRYYFTSRAIRYSMEVVTLRRDGDVVGVCIISDRDGHLRVPLCHTPGCEGDLAAYLDHYAVSQRVNRCTVYHSGLVDAFGARRTHGLYHKATTRHYLVSSRYSSIDWTAYRIQDGAGDTFFT